MCQQTVDTTLLHSFSSKNRSPIASSKAWVQFHSPKTAQSLSRAFGGAVSRRRDLIRWWGRRLLHSRRFYYVVRKQTSTLFWNDMRSTFERPSRNIVTHLIRRHDTPAQEHYFDSSVPNRSSLRKLLSIYNWNPGSRHGTEGAIEKQIAGKQQFITLQEAIEYVDHELLTIRFHVTHQGGCAVFFNKGTYLPDVKVKSIYRHDIRHVVPDKVM